MALQLSRYVTFHGMTEPAQQGSVALVFHRQGHPIPVGVPPPAGCPSDDCILAVYVIPADDLEDHIEMLRRAAKGASPDEHPGSN